MTWFLALLSQVSGMTGEATIVGQEELLDRVVAVVGTEAITLAELNTTVFMLYGTQLPPGITQDAARRRILEELINQELLYQEAKADTSIKVTPEEVNQAIKQQMDALKTKMGPEEFARQLAAEGMTEQDLTSVLRENVEVSLYIQKLIDRRIKPNIVVTQEEVRKFYEENKDSIAVEPASYRLSHILIRIEPSGPAEQEAYGKAKGLYRQIMAGADFADIASRYSDDQQTASQGGQLGWYPKAYLPPEITKELDALRPGEVSKPLRGETGYHIFQILDRRQGAYLLRHILINVIPEKADSSKARTKANRVMNLAKSGKSFSELARIYSDDPTTKELGGDLGRIPENVMTPEILSAIKDANVGDIVGPVPTPSGYSIIKITDKTEQVIHPYEEVSEYIRNYLYQMKVQEELNKLLDRIKQRVYVEIRL